MFVSCVHPVAVLNAAFCMTCSLLMLVKDAIGDHTEEAYSVALLMCLFVLCVACLIVFVNCLVKQFAMCVGVVAILLLNVMDLFSVSGGALLDRPCMVFQRECVLCL